MAMTPDIAILAKAPIPGFAKTRLIPAIGAHAAAVLQERLTERTVATPDAAHGSFRDLAGRFAITLRRQPQGDLGARMLAAFDGGAALVIGTDCPALTPQHLRDAAAALDGAALVLTPAEDGGYVLIGARRPHPELFSGMAWSTATVVAETRKRIASLGLTSIELSPLWDVDSEGDLARMERDLPALAL